MTDEQFADLIAKLNDRGSGWPDIVQAISAVLTLLMLVLAFIQFRQMKKEMKLDHARSRRQLAVELCAGWVANQEPQTFEMCRFVDQLDKKQIDSILTSATFEVSANCGVQLKKLFEGFAHSEECFKKTGNKLTITEVGSQQLRYLAIRYLNQLETVFVAWASGVCDQEIIEKQFGPLLDGRAGRNALSSFREQIGTAHFPNFDAFVSVERGKAAKPHMPPQNLVQ
jgi:hypothetical protein